MRVGYLERATQSRVVQRIAMLAVDSGEGYRHQWRVTSTRVNRAIEPELLSANLDARDYVRATLGQRRDKTCAIKQGMTRELLTGQTRLL